MTKLSLFGLLCVVAVGNLGRAQTPPKARVIVRSKADAIAHLDLAPGDLWMLSRSGQGDNFRLWNLKKPSNARALPGQFFAWSHDGARLTTWDDSKADDSKGQQRLTVLDLNSQKVAQFPLDLPTAGSAVKLEFAPDGRTVKLRASNFKRTFTWTLDARTGKMREVEETKGSRTMTATPKRHFVRSDYQEVGTQVQVYDLNGHKIYDWHNPSEYDVWELSSDGKLMWRSSFDTGRFNFYDALSGHLLWRLPTTEADSGTFFHYPQWSKDGKVVGFVKGQTLRTYDARTGKVLHTVDSYSFNRNAFADGRDAYALSQHGDFLIVADASKHLWRVSLR